MVKQLKIVSINGVMTGTTSMQMAQPQPVKFKLMGKSSTSIQVMVDKLKALLHQMVITTMKTLVTL